MSDEEKKLNVDVPSPTEHASITHGDFEEPPQEKSLHRGLKARQISMIAVSLQRCNRL